MKDLINQVNAQNASEEVAISIEETENAPVNPEKDVDYGEKSIRA